MSEVSDQQIKQKFTEPITIEQAAKDLGMSYSTLRRRMKQLKIKAWGKPFARGYQITCKDGHVVDSIGEARVDNWLFELRIRHWVHWKLVGTGCWVDFWLIDYGLGLEYVGVEKIVDYQERITEKQELYEHWNIPVVFITPKTKLDATLIHTITRILRQHQRKKEATQARLGL